MARRERSRGASSTEWTDFPPALLSWGALAFSFIVVHHEQPSHCADALDVTRVQALRSRLADLLSTSEEARWLDDGDWTLHRFLVSRNNSVADAEAMFRGTVAWRSDHKVRAELVKWQEQDCGGAGERALALKYGYAARAGWTDDGCPLNVERVGQYDIAGCVRVPGMTDLVAKSYVM